MTDIEIIGRGDASVTIGQPPAVEVDKPPPKVREVTPADQTAIECLCMLACEHSGFYLCAVA